MSKETKYYKVFSLKLAEQLCRQGFHVVKTEPNRQKPWLYVYEFDDTEALRNAIQAYKLNCKG
ncbi:MAG: DUF5659 domain-containing protein [Lachnospiraceae bacterium]|nr:DUF5659 domain-containing protein [Lachnospiraceae bacterium]